MVLLGAAKPDRIELETGLQRWTEVSWFLDEAEVATRGGDSGATSELPKAWRLGNRPNLRQMHDDACRNRVPPALIESQLVDAIERQRMLTSGASAAGARVHNLPARPRDIADDGAFHYAVLGPRAASDRASRAPKRARSSNRRRPRIDPGCTAMRSSWRYRRATVSMLRARAYATTSVGRKFARS